ncbi:MAG: site-specific integrase, partial [Planctomycetota bacterium]
MTRRQYGSGSLERRNGGVYVGRYYDENGKRRRRSTHTSDRRAAERILAKWVEEASLRREGIIDPEQARFSEARGTSVASHVEAYLESCRARELARKHVRLKERVLADSFAACRFTRLADLDAERLASHLHELRREGKAARTVNSHRQQLVAFGSWLLDTGRVPSNPMLRLPRFDESSDRRRVRRALTDEELSRLFAVAEAQGGLYRLAWYLGAALAGLRRGDLKRICWRDVDFEERLIRVRGGKAKREDLVPLHPQLREALEALKVEAKALPTAHVFPREVTTLTVRKDMDRAGIAREDDQGRVADLHGLRTTLATALARNGVAPQIARGLMRHSSYETTLASYTALRTEDYAAALESVGRLGEHGQKVAESQANGTDGIDSGGPEWSQFEPQLGTSPCDSVRKPASQAVDRRSKASRSNQSESEEAQRYSANCGICGAREMVGETGL